jgi:quinoprotein glucose dehydrogenase
MCRLKKSLLNNSVPVNNLPFFSIIILFACSFFACRQNTTGDYINWEVVGGSKEGIRYSSLSQIDTNNIQLLKPVWEYHTNDSDTANHSQIQCNPIVIGDVLYGGSPQQKIFAIDAFTGVQKWIFNPYDTTKKDAEHFSTNNIRGVTFWKSGDEQRIFFTAGSFLHVLDAKTGNPVTSFGKEGKVDLHDGLGRDCKDLFITYTSPGVIYKDLIIIGSRVDEGPNAAPGHIRAYDVRTGKQVWIFHTIPQPGEEGYESWEDPEAWKHIGGANCWSGFTLDEKKGIVFAPIGSASYDFYGGKRKGANLFADCLLALDAATGKKIWHFQQIHHDIWDRDIPTPPALVSINRNGKTIEAVAQPTKTGFVFVLDRNTGEPLFPINEISVPVETDLAGEKPFPTQPIPTLPKPFVRQTFQEKDINNLISVEEQDSLRKKLAGLNHDHMFSPPSQKGTVIFPGYDGGAEWGGPAFDPASGILYVNANEMPWILQMVEMKNKQRENETWLQAGQRLFKSNCQTCHGANREGGGNYPSLLKVSEKYTATQLDELLLNGRRMMPAFKQLKEEERKAISSFILNNRNEQSKKFISAPVAADSFLNMPYMGTGYNKFLTREGYSAISPPWGSLNAINLNTGELVWKVPLGEIPEFASKGIITGTENYGGPVVTAGGLVFIAATKDNKIRAFNKYTGKLLWESVLPASGFATPAIYQLKGKQFLVIACGGGKLKTTSGDSYLAFALPENK